MCLYDNIYTHLERIIDFLQELINRIYCKNCVELLKTIAVSTENYQTLKNMGRAGDKLQRSNNPFNKKRQLP